MFAESTESGARRRKVSSRLLDEFRWFHCQISPSFSLCCPPAITSDLGALASASAGLWEALVAKRSHLCVLGGLSRLHPFALGTVGHALQPWAVPAEASGVQKHKDRDGAGISSLLLPPQTEFFVSLVASPLGSFSSTVPEVPKPLGRGISLVSCTARPQCLNLVFFSNPVSLLLSISCPSPLPIEPSLITEYPITFPGHSRCV